MFDDLTKKLTNIFDKLKSVGYIREEDIEKASREIRIALLEADVALPVIKELLSLVKERAIGKEVAKSVSSGQMVVKIVQDCLEEILTSDSHEIKISKSTPSVILMVGLQGSGKTTTAAKIANKLKKEGKKVYLASLDTYRPAAQEQLQLLSDQISVDCFPAVGNSMLPTDIAEKALKEAEDYDVLIFDTAGRSQTNTELMQELEDIKSISSPTEILLVADSIIGQDAVNIAQEFNNVISITGVVLTRVDSDARGGAALSMSYVTKCPIKFLGVGEKISELEVFHPDRIASRILDMGDIVSLVEKASAISNKEEDEKLLSRLNKGHFDLDIFAVQIKKMQKMGGMSSIIKMIPGINKMIKNSNPGNLDDSLINKQLAIINSMTRQEKKNPKILNASRKIRIASGSGTKVPEINKLVKQFLQMQKMLKKLGGIDKDQLMQGMKGF